jgi:hypothetical protein
LVRIEYAGINREPFGQDTICRDIKSPKVRKEYFGKT